MKEVSCFEDLVFAPHRNKIKGAVQAQHELTNGITISVVGGGQGLYGDGIEDFEVGAWQTKGGDWIRLSEHDDVIGWRNKEQVTEIIQKLLGM